MAELYNRPEKIYLKAMQRLNIDKKFDRALDVACGTGISTRAIAKTIAKQVIGLDASEHMLAYAKLKQNEKITYQLGRAEKLPFPDKSFDLVTICVALHCVDQEKFISEAERILKENGQLIILHSKLSGLEIEKFSNWINNVFYKKYPFFPGNRDYMADKNKSELLVNHSNMFYPEYIKVTIEETAALLMTTSGVFMAEENPEEIKKWLLRELRPFFSNSTISSFRIDMSLWWLTKILKLEPTHVFKL